MVYFPIDLQESVNSADSEYYYYQMRLFARLLSSDADRLATKFEFRRKGQSQWYLLKKSWLQRGSFKEKILKVPDFLQAKGNY